MPATLILNPYANRWKCGGHTERVEDCLRRNGIDYALKTTSGPMHATELARSAAEAGDLPLIAAGGDGTYNEVVNGLLQAIPHSDLPAGPVGLLPLGTANDLADMLDLPRDLEVAAQVIAAGHTRVIDVGKVNGHYFANNSAVGLEPLVTIENIRLTWLRGVIRYLVAAVITIMKRPSWEAELKWDSGSYTGSLTLVSVGNTRRTGGVFYMTPNALPNDGKLDFIFSPALSRARLLQLLPKTQSGVHISEPDVQEHRTIHLTIHTKPHTPIQADGELIAEESINVVYEVVAGALQVFAPDSSSYRHYGSKSRGILKSLRGDQRDTLMPLLATSRDVT